MPETNREIYEARLLKKLSNHVGAHRPIGMDALFEAVYGDPAEHKINSTKKHRVLVTKLRSEGVPIGSTSDSNGGGYYLTSAGSELEAYLSRLHNRALKALVLESKIRKISLPELLGQIQLNLRGEAA